MRGLCRQCHSALADLRSVVAYDDYVSLGGGQPTPLERCGVKEKNTSCRMATSYCSDSTFDIADTAIMMWVPLPSAAPAGEADDTWTTLSRRATAEGSGRHNMIERFGDDPLSNAIYPHIR